MDGKLIVASARLPVTVRSEGEGWTAEASPGGLATALRAVADRRPFTWIGWPGTYVGEEDREAVRDKLAVDNLGIPVFIDEAEHEGFYGEFSNRVLWPLFHNLTGPLQFDEHAWELYQRVNRRFADAILEHARPGDTIWVHDYQLALVPRMLRESSMECPIGFFLHIPFPSSETYRTLPVRESILRGMLGADLIGFHAYEYVGHFRSSTLRILGLESDPEAVLLPTHHAHLGVLPIGIEPGEIDEFARTEECVDQYEELERAVKGRKVILGVDRLDYTKGLPQKLLAFEELLRDNPELREQVVLIQVASPSRTGVAEYQALKRELDELAGRISGTYSTLGTSPLIYINQHIPRSRLTALYQLADIALVTPVRDGMNLVALEYVAARGDKPGTLVLSEFTGAAPCLPGAVLVNPHNPSEIAEALAAAVALDKPSAEAFAHMREFVLRNTSVAWAERFLRRLESNWAVEDQRHRRLSFARKDIADRARGARGSLIVLAYDGTIRPHVTMPSYAAPSRELRALLANLADVASVYVVSGRQAELLDAWLGDLPVGLVSEHGYQTKRAGGMWSEPPRLDLRPLDEMVAPVFRDFTERTPGSQVERKAGTIAWHYRGSDPKFGTWRAKELHSVLETSLANEPFAVLAGARVIEVRHAEVSKARAAQALLEEHAGADLIFCAGNDRTDEDMLEVMQRAGRERTFVCQVGSTHSGVEFFVETPQELVHELETLADLLAGGG
jgi:trehalose 6-phosphate synthase/phosphatase